MFTAADVPPALADSHACWFGDAGRAWIAALPALVADQLDRWNVRVAGGARVGAVALVLPVLRRDGAPAALKLQPVDDETAGEPLALRTWDGDGAVRLLGHDPATGTMLLERLDGARDLTALGEEAALEVLGGLLARLSAVAAPPGLRDLGTIARGLLARTPPALAAVADAEDRQLLRTCAAAVGELADEPGDRLLHWDLHHENVLAAEREPWLAIDPKPLAGDPCFELLPALRDRWPEAVATGDAPRAVRRRFDLLTGVAGLDRRRAAGWTLGRVLQDVLWDLDDGAAAVHPVHAAVFRALVP
ncbi:aminoglycoside phosphotransferase family protein [Umezawaea beigongshangensis]|uniref:aminoglycoside phosphotransferase family protein n=1 Tax=Umezawaea beigongshangensis TaxID=2780383 RepID=UPI0018F1EA93|nr:aminoglycoside phosphotransferase family protein [Umezawaea beigongshangensis]